MLTPLKRAGGRRLYRPSDSALLETIKDLIERQGFTIRGACQYLQQSNRNEKFDALATDRALPGAQLPQASPTHIVPGLLAIRARLLNALEQV
jgi:DNA-binding transcriptional MerR regulator